jgi:hypothetical protein
VEQIEKTTTPATIDFNKRLLLIMMATFLCWRSRSFSIIPSPPSVKPKDSDETVKGDILANGQIGPFCLLFLANLTSTGTVFCFVFVMGVYFKTSSQI